MKDTTPLAAVAEDGNLNTSAEFGVMYLVRITYNTDPTGKWVDGNIDDSNQTLHGPFETEDEGMAWIIAYPDGDTDVCDMDVIVFNKVRP
jgi:hypothetical protein